MTDDHPEGDDQSMPAPNAEAGLDAPDDGAG